MLIFHLDRKKAKAFVGQFNQKLSERETLERKNSVVRVTHCVVWQKVHQMTTLTAMKQSNRAKKL